MWVLILTLTYTVYGGFATIEHVPGFPTPKACVAAGNAWIQHLGNLRPAAAKAICVYQPEKK